MTHLVVTPATARQVGCRCCWRTLRRLARKTTVQRLDAERAYFARESQGRTPGLLVCPGCESTYLVGHALLPRVAGSPLRGA